MAKLNLAPEVSNAPDWTELRRAVSMAFKSIYELLNGRLNFSDNLRGKIIDVSFVASNTDTVIIHNLGFIPSYYLVIKSNVATQIYTGDGSWTNELIYLKASAISNCSIFVF